MPFVRPSEDGPAAAVPQDKLAELVRRAFGCDLRASPMPGGAGARRYFRLALPAGKSAVAVFVPEGGRPEEVQPAVARGSVERRWPFLEVRDLLAEHGVDVPAILAEDTAHGWIVIEDLGDLTLARWLESRPEERATLYRRAVRDLARAQNELASLPSGCLVEARNFEADLLFWELEHFREWVLEARGKPLSAADRPRWQALTELLARRVAELPRGFVHRDYQSRNLMVVPRSSAAEPRLVWIDFQDALLGPRVYDLVALLTDSHQEFDRAFVEARLDDYAEAAALADGDEPGSKTSLAEEFDLVMVQRKMKDAGRFVFIDRKKGNGNYLRFVPPTVGKIGGALARLAERDPTWGELRAILERTLGDEWSGS